MSNFRRAFSIIVAAVLVMSMLAVGASAAGKIKVGMVTDIGGLGDQSFNDSAYNGLLRAQSELGSDILVIESNKMDDYEPNLLLALDEGADLAWAIGFLMTDAVANIAPLYPDKKFGIIDSVVDAPNVLSVTFKEEEGSFLVGVLAGLWTKTNKVGFVGGMDVPVIEKFESGFVAGVKAANPKAEILIGYTGSFNDPGKGKELANTQYAQGVDIIFHASGACGTGVIEAAKAKGLYAIGVDSDQSHLAPKNVVASMIKRVDNGVFMGAEALSKGEFKAGHVVLGLAEEGVGVAYSPEIDVPKAILDKIDDYKKQIIDGKIVVPATREEVKKFKI